MNRYQQLANTGAIAELQVKEKEQAFTAQARLKGAEATLDPSAAPVAIATERARGEATPSHIEQRTKEPAKRANRNPKPNQPRCERTNKLGLNLRRLFCPRVRHHPETDLRNASQVVRPGEAIAQIAPQ